MDIIIHPSYFPNIHQFNQIIKANNILFEVSDNYQKQTYRNRAYIAHSNGKLLLNIPIRHSKNINICYDTDWMALHLKSLQSAYRSSPYFEYFEDNFIELFVSKNVFSGF